MPLCPDSLTEKKSCLCTSWLWAWNSRCIEQVQKICSSSQDTYVQHVRVGIILWQLYSRSEISFQILKPLGKCLNAWMSLVSSRQLCNNITIGCLFFIGEFAKAGFWGALSPSIFVSLMWTQISTKYPSCGWDGVDGRDSANHLGYTKKINSIVTKLPFD